jgi:hypothetical protein
MSAADLLPVTSSRRVVSSVFVAVLVTFLTHVRDVGESSSLEQSPRGISTHQAGDMMSLLQDARIQVEFNSLQDNGLKEVAKQEPGSGVVLVDAAPTSSGVQPARLRKVPTGISMLSIAGTHGGDSMAFARIGKALAVGLRSKLWESSCSRFFSMRHAMSSGSVAICLMLILIGCTCIGALALVNDSKAIMPQKNLGVQPPETPVHAPVDSASPRLIPTLPLQEMQSHYPYVSPAPTSVATFTVPRSSVRDTRLPAKAKMSDVLSPFSSNLDPNPLDPNHPRPPPLCPTLVLPVVEARFGIPMHELAKLVGEGELNIVGISGNPLLRAAVRKAGASRKLEISMPEPHSAPRATVVPSTMKLDTHSQQGSQALEIREVRGALYGTIEMRGSGACYVVKDGHTVLTIDGEEHSLQLSIRSSIGLPLASVKCSSETFGGVDHVEVRVEPGVDTVLVLAVVLSVLLLSPYLPSQAGSWDA